MEFGQLLLLTSLIGAFVLTVFLIGLSWYFRHRRLQLWHETLRLALEKGQSAPAELREIAAQPPALSSRRDIRTGLVLIAISLGIWVFLTYAGSKPSPYRYFVSVPAFVGVALMLHEIFVRLTTRGSASDE